MTCDGDCDDDDYYDDNDDDDEKPLGHEVRGKIV